MEGLLFVVVLIGLIVAVVAALSRPRPSAPPPPQPDDPWESPWHKPLPDPPASRSQSQRPVRKANPRPPGPPPDLFTPAAAARARRAAGQFVGHIEGQAWVVDGDTIVIDGVSIRLFGIDAPEMDHPYGHPARRHMIALCRGQRVRAELDGSTSHDRLVARCFLPDGRDLSAEMVRAGLALDWPKFSGGAYRHLEEPGARQRMWRIDARQKGRMPPPAPRV